MLITRNPKSLIREIRRAWALVREKERRRLQLVAGYGVLIAGLETIALILLFAVINLLDDQPLNGVTKALIPAGISSDSRYRQALILMTITALLFVVRSLRHVKAST
jgi:hypothetical protein